MPGNALDVGFTTARDTPPALEEERLTDTQPWRLWSKLLLALKGRAPLTNATEAWKNSGYGGLSPSRRVSWRK